MKKYIIFKTKGGKSYISCELILNDNDEIIVNLDGLSITQKVIDEALITSSPLMIYSHCSDGWLTLKDSNGFTFIGKSLRDIVTAYPNTLTGSTYVSEKVFIQNPNQPCCHTL